MKPPDLAWVRRARVGSLNEPKIAAAEAALTAYAPGARVVGTEVDSGVPEQPVGFAEIVQGARNRASAARAAGGDLGIGIEDGLVHVTEAEGQHLNLGCAAVTEGRRMGLGFSSGFAYPDACTTAAVQDREPIGPLFDRLWEARRGERDGIPSGRSVGNVGKLTGGVLTRQEYGRHAVLCALVRFLHPDLYGDPA